MSWYSYVELMLEHFDQAIIAGKNQFTLWSCDHKTTQLTGSRSNGYPFHYKINESKSLGSLLTKIKQSGNDDFSKIFKSDLSVRNKENDGIIYNLKGIKLLSNDEFNLILTFCNPIDIILNISLVNKQYRNFIQTADYVWQFFYTKIDEIPNSSSIITMNDFIEKYKKHLVSFYLSENEKYFVKEIRKDDKLIIIEARNDKNTIQIAFTKQAVLTGIVSNERGVCLKENQLLTMGMYLYECGY
ncbi:hypothetical protein ABK040_009511 [Willaertia magna]